MKSFFFILIMLSPAGLFAQDIDSMYVHLYTDSLKKGTYNYINIDGKLKNGRYIPLDTSEVVFTADQGKFYGNSLWLPADFNQDKVTIRVILKQDPDQKKQFDLYVKKAKDPELPTEKELIKKRRH